MRNVLLLALAILPLPLPGVPPDYAPRRGNPVSDVRPMSPASRLVAGGVLSAAALDSLEKIPRVAGADLEWTIARAFDWRPTRGDSPDAWRNEARRRLGAIPNRLDVALVATLCETAARSSGYALAAARDSSFLRSLLTHTSLHGTSLGAVAEEPVSRRTMLEIVANARFPMVRILETTDFHGALLPGTGEGPRDRPMAGAAMLAAHVRKLRAENPEGTILLDGGDMFQGTMISNLSFGRSVVDHMNLLGYTAAAIGNHEFDWGVDTLVSRIRQMQFAALGANIRERSTGRRPSWARSDTVVARRGVKVGILGLSYRLTSSVTLSKQVEHLRFVDDSMTAVLLVPSLAKRSHVVIGVGHVPAIAGENDRLRSGDLRRLARIPGVSAWFGGHSHNNVAEPKALPAIAIAGSHGRTIAVCDLVVDPIGRRVISQHTRLLPARAEGIASDSATAALVERWNENVAPLAAAPLGRNERKLSRNRNGESALGNFVADAVRIAASADIGFQNSGGLRADLAAGVITRGAIYEVMPFDNHVFTLELTGAEVRRALEEGLSTGRVTQVSGIRYTFDSGRPRMDRVVALTLEDGKPLHSSRTYRVAINDFMATGGDEYGVFGRGRNRKELETLVREAMESLVAGLEARGKKLDYRAEGRIRRNAVTGVED